MPGRIGAIELDPDTQTVRVDWHGYALDQVDTWADRVVQAAWEHGLRYVEFVHGAADVGGARHDRPRQPGGRGARTREGPAAQAPLPRPVAPLGGDGPRRQPPDRGGKHADRPAREPAGRTRRRAGRWSHRRPTDSRCRGDCPEPLRGRRPSDIQPVRELREAPEGAGASGARQGRGEALPRCAWRSQARSSRWSTRPTVSRGSTWPGVRRNVNIGLLDADGGGAQPGDWVLIHVGFAISKIDEEEASRRAGC